MSASILRTCAQIFSQFVIKVSMSYYLASIVSSEEAQTPRQRSCIGVGLRHSSNNLQTLAGPSNQKCHDLLFFFIWALQDTLECTQNTGETFGRCQSSNKIVDSKFYCYVRYNGTWIIITDVKTLFVGPLLW